MGNTQPQPTKPNSSAQYVLIRQSNGEVMLVEKEKVQELFLNS